MTIPAWCAPSECLLVRLLMAKYGGPLQHDDVGMADDYRKVNWAFCIVLGLVRQTMHRRE